MRPLRLRPLVAAWRASFIADAAFAKPRAGSPIRPADLSSFEENDIHPPLCEPESSDTAGISAAVS